MNNAMTESTAMAVGAGLGLGFLVAKAGIRHLVHSVVAAPTDVWLVPAWLGVDLCILSLSLALGGKLFRGMAQNDVALMMLLWFTCLAASVSAYSRFLKRRQRVPRKPPHSDAILRTHIMMSLFVGFAVLSWTAGRAWQVSTDHSTPDKGAVAATP